MYVYACLTVNFTEILKVSRISIVSRMPFFGCEVSCKKVRLIIREIRYCFLYRRKLNERSSMVTSNQSRQRSRAECLNAPCKTFSVEVQKEDHRQSKVAPSHLRSTTFVVRMRYGNVSGGCTYGGSCQPCPSCWMIEKKTFTTSQILEGQHRPYTYGTWS